MSFRFSTYSVDELRAAGAAFAADFAVFASDDTKARTLAIMHWFYDAMAIGLRCYGSPFDKEYLVDQCHTTFPLPVGDEHWSARWDRALSGPCEFRLALESEVGRYRDPNESRALVLDDAWKVALIRATAKVVAFASQNPADRAKIVRCLEVLRRQSLDNAPWLWLDIPWDYSGKRPRDAAWGVFPDSN